MGKITHGETKTAIYARWRTMKERCYNPKSISYNEYGGSGLKVCDEWLGRKCGFTNFRDWSYAN